MAAAPSFPYKTICITGGTGTFGHAFLAYIRQHHPDVHVRIVSRHEDLQIRMRARFGESNVSYLLGDVRDQNRMQLALQGVECVIHAAALKHVPGGEYDPNEFAGVNVLGTQTTIHAALVAGAQQFVFLSSDKAVQPVNLYGATKMVAERLTVQANHYSPHGMRLCVTRYGNVMGARGSVLEVWRAALAAGKPLCLTDEAMTRFWMWPDEAVRLVLWVIVHGLRGAVAVPHLQAFRLTDLARVLLLNSGTWMVTGMRPGEKLAEVLMTPEEQARAWWYAPEGQTPVHYVIPALVQHWGGRDERDLWMVPPTELAYGRCDGTPHASVPYVSDTWPWRLSVEALRARLASQGKV